MFSKRKICLLYKMFFLKTISPNKKIERTLHDRQVLKGLQIKRTFSLKKNCVFEDYRRSLDNTVNSAYMDYLL